MRTLMAFTLPLATFGTLLAVVACGPTKNSVSVQPEARGAISQAVYDCKRGLSGSRTKMVEGEERTVSLCQNGEIVQQPYAYSLSKNESDQLTVSLKIGVFLPSGSSLEQKTQVAKSLGVYCQDRISRVLSRSLRGDLQVESKYTFAVSASENEPAPVEELKGTNILSLLPGDSNSDYVAYRMAAFANGASFYPYGKKDEITRCKSLSGGLLVQNACVQKSLHQTNQAFCVQLTKMTGAWLGLVDENSERKACGMPEQVAKKPKSSALMQALSNEDAPKFFEVAKLELSEIKSILSPTCEAFAKMDVTKTTSRR